MPQGKLLYIRARRSKTVVFLCYESNDSIENLKQKLCAAQPGCDKSPDQIRIYARRSDQYTILIDSDSVSSAGLESESDIYFVYHSQGKWEEVHTEAYEPLDEGAAGEEEQDVDMHAEISHTRKEKGKGRA
ncbi:hypothetical protein BDB00DRAFT_835575 [Zychaea mexicana]|uniref:uncharacterized protein n=1 Tax=Zychaea mexicana TaxID=64656 RepID=UPI0022FDB227|nr:uncharacterized protein BDB00DRAFT_835575 [Zychaea mexicana]KAI9491002.1 hypothetical protein BDB00DRAFT_835575 [Zychaea mexicana]